MLASLEGSTSLMENGNKGNLAAIGMQGGRVSALSTASSVTSLHSDSPLHVSGGGSTPEMDDILVVSYQQSQVANLWVNYLNSCFDTICKQRGRTPFRVLCVGLDEICGAVPLALQERMVRVRLQVLVVCPLFLQRLTEQPSPGSALSKLVQPDRVLTMLLGVTEDAISHEHKTAVGPNFSLWRLIPVRDKDSAFVGEFLNEAMTVLARVASEQHAARQEKAGFSLLPKKVKQSHNKVVVMLNEPLEKDDKVKVTVNKNGETLEISAIKRRNPYTLHFNMPETCMEISMLVTVRLEKNGVELGSRQIKCESRMRELDQLLRTSDNPLEFMCQTLGFNLGDREQLDTFLTTAFQRNLPPNFNIFQAASQHEGGGSYFQRRHHASSEEFPTLLHFAAKFGMEKLAWQLLECPGGEQACEIRNGSDLTPADIADSSGHAKLGSALRGYLQMSELTSMYCYLKMAAQGDPKVSHGPPKSPKTPPISSTTNGGEQHAPVMDGVDYHMPRPLSETYQVPPAARPVFVSKPCSADESLYNCRDSTETNGGYLEMFPSKTTPSGSPQLTRQLPPLPPLPENKPDFFKNSGPTICVTKSTLDRGMSPLSIRNGEDETSKRTTRKMSREHGGIQDELVEIIQDFKNSVLEIEEVEKLVENWKNRNDVQQSFKEKQEQLNMMREEYDRIQRKMKDEMKKPTPFERIRNFFGKGKKDHKQEVSAPAVSEEKTTLVMNTLHPGSTDLGQRPASSLSLHSISSSSSSERMSTMSACSGISLGDSGTHSDPEDRKMLPPLQEPPFLLEEPHSTTRMIGIHCYEVPPAPRPVTEARVKPRLNLNLNKEQLLRNSPYDRPPLPVPRPGFEQEHNRENSEEAHYLDTVSNGTEDLGPNTPCSTVDGRDYHNLTSSSADGDMPNYMNVCADVGMPPPVPPRIDLPPRVPKRT